MKSLSQNAAILTTEQKIEHISSLFEKASLKKDVISTGLQYIHNLRTMCIIIVYFPSFSDFERVSSHDGENSCINYPIPDPLMTLIRGIYEEINNEKNDKLFFNSKEREYFKLYRQAYSNIQKDSTNTTLYDAGEQEFHTYRYDQWVGDQEQDGWTFVPPKSSGWKRGRRKPHSASPDRNK